MIGVARSRYFWQRILALTENYLNFCHEEMRDLCLGLSHGSNLVWFYLKNHGEYYIFLANVAFSWQMLCFFSGI